MEYKIIITRNKKFLKRIYKCKTYKTASEKFEKFTEENKVNFPKKNVNGRRILPVKYEILLIKEKEADDSNIIIRNDLGKLIEIRAESGKWTVLNIKPFLMEETFWVYGNDPVHGRLTVIDIQNIILKKIKVATHTKQIIVVHNKLIIQYDDDIDIVFCKCKEDANRLYNYLYDNNNHLKRLLFLGKASQKMISNVYDLMRKKTGWSDKRIRRPSTRH